MQTKSRRDTLLLFALVFWILFVFGGYYYYHKPINIEMLSAPLNALADILFVLLFAGLAGGIGSRLLPAERIPALERAALQFALGAGMLSLAWFVFGILGWYHFPLALPLLLLGILLLRKYALDWFRQFQGLKKAWQNTLFLEKFLALVSALLVLYQMFVALAPPIKWDALAYHLQIPRQFLAAGGLVFIPENPYWGHPQLVEMLYTFAMSFHRAETAALLGWSAGIIFLIGLLGVTNTLLDRFRQESTGSTAGWMAVFAVVAGLTFRSLLGWSYTDLFSALFGLAALVALFAWLDARDPAWFLWAGLFSGFALGTKWTAGVLLLAVMSAGLLFRKKVPLSLQKWLLAAALAFLLTTPWLTKNLVMTGSPIYPYFFGTPWLNSARIVSANLPPESIDWWQHILLPFSTTWAGVDSAPGFSPDLGPLLLLFALPGFFLYWRDPKTKSMALLLGFVALGAGVGSIRLGHLLQTRLYFAALPALAIPCGWGWEWVQCQVLQEVRLRRIFGAAVLLVMSLILWQDSYAMARTAPAAVTIGTQSQQSYLENTLGFTILAMQKLEKLPPDTRILMLWEPRGLYAPLNAQADLWIDRWRTDRRELGSATAILQHWREQGFTYLLVYQPGIEIIRPQPGQPSTADWTVFQDLMALIPAPDTSIENYLLYRLP